MIIRPLSRTRALLVYRTERIGESAGYTRWILLQNKSRHSFGVAITRPSQNQLAVGTAFLCRVSRQPGKHPRPTHILTCAHDIPRFSATRTPYITSLAYHTNNMDRGPTSKLFNMHNLPYSVGHECEARSGLRPVGREAGWFFRNKSVCNDASPNQCLAVVNQSASPFMPTSITALWGSNIQVTLSAAFSQSGGMIRH
jgi:hypothetical protein